MAELVALGVAVRAPPLEDVAIVVAQALIEQVRHNLTMLIERLRTLDYTFMAPHNIWLPPNAQRTAAVDDIEQRFGVLPVVLRAWYDVVGEVNFAGFHSRLNHHHRVDPIGETEPFGDALEVAYWPDAVGSFYTQATSAAKFTAPLSSFEFASNIRTKAGYSGSNDYHIILPARGFDTPLFADPHWTGTFFIPYLRTCFQWGSFPGLSYQPEAAAAAQKELAFLTKDLLPI